jgi:D-alanyl-D-alanine carboxypeptidase
MNPRQAIPKAKHWLTFTVACWFLGCASVTADPPTDFPQDLAQRIDTAVSEQMQADNLPSVAVGIWIVGKREFVFAKGKGNIEIGASRNVDDPFRVASITKTFTATVILRLADDGKLSLSDKLAKWYPDFPNANEITVDDLLRMRSGIPDSADQAFVDNYYDNPEEDVSADEMIQRAKSRRNEFSPPDKKTKYCNVNYSILEDICRRVSGKSLGDQIHDKILKPLGMTYSFYPVSHTLPGKLRGYGWNAETSRFEDKTIINPAPAGGAGAMISNLADLKTYAKALYTGALLKPEIQKNRLRCQPIQGQSSLVQYGEGIGRLGKFFGHNGTIMGFSSEMWYLPEKDAVIAINVNRLDKDDQSKSTKLFFVISKIMFPREVSW